jgi:hypothetical protein
LAFGLFRSPDRDDGGADGSPVFRSSPWTRAAPPTPGEPIEHPDSRSTDVAFAVT